MNNKFTIRQISEKLNYYGEKISEIFGGIFLMALFFIIPVAVVNNMDWGFFTSEMTTYHEYCLGDYNANFCSSGFIEARADKYKIYSDAQAVVWSNDLGYIEKYTNCEIFDRKNWSCNIDNNHEIGFRNGNYYVKPEKQKLDNKGHFFIIKNISKWDWAKYSCKRGQSLCILSKFIYYN